jgi:hypothetical protein
MKRKRNLFKKHSSVMNILKRTVILVDSSEFSCQWTENLCEEHRFRLAGISFLMINSDHSAANIDLYIAY